MSSPVLFKARLFGHRALVARMLSGDPPMQSCRGGRSSLLSSAHSVLIEMCAMLFVPGIVPLVVAFGLQMGMYGTWSGLLSDILDSCTTVKLTAEEVGSLGAVNTFAGIAGGLIVGGMSSALMRRVARHLLARCTSHIGISPSRNETTTSAGSLVSSTRFDQI